MKIEALHDFHDEAFSRAWADKFEPTSPRLALFETMLREIKSRKQQAPAMLELGIGPGFLAEYLLQRLPDITYEGLDFSKPMLKLAAQRTEAHQARIRFTQADLIQEPWPRKVQTAPDMIVSTWALHDLFSRENILSVYRRAFGLLPAGGLLLNGDFVKPEGSTFAYEGGRITPSEQLALLREAGFAEVVCLEEFEKSVENPTTANNYACFRAVK